MIQVSTINGKYIEQTDNKLTNCLEKIRISSKKLIQINFQNKINIIKNFRYSKQKMWHIRRKS